jgi:predicted RNA binding protein YcfA (HicA-like mRNA interferase family)
MSELPSIAGRQVVKALGKIGYELNRQARKSYHTQTKILSLSTHHHP